MRSDRKLGIVLSTTDLLHFLSCEELPVLDLFRSRGKVSPLSNPASTDLAAKLGLLSEAEAVEILGDKYGKAVKIGGDPTAAFEATRKAMENGARLIYQGVILQRIDGFVYESRPDFLVRVDLPSALGDYSYEPVDSKMAKSPKLDSLFQVIDYADAVASIQGILPRQVHLFLAGSQTLSYFSENYVEEIRLQRSRFISHISKIQPINTDSNVFAALDPKPNELCGICDWSLSCEEYWRNSDSLFRVAGITKGQVTKLVSAGVSTLTQLAHSEASQVSTGIPSDSLARLIVQAKAQETSIAQETAVPYFEVRADAYRLALDGKGLGLLPRPSLGDIFFDIEGDPFYKPDGLEYLFGISYQQDGESVFRAFWGTDPESEKRAFGELVDFITERWERHRDLHIYHYADYERAALAKLASKTNSKIYQVDQILRYDLLVDLYPIVKGTLVVGSDSYSLKKIEKIFQSQPRTEQVTTAMGSVEAFEGWLANGNGALLEEIERYNEMDVRSTEGLRDFLLTIRERVVLAQGEFPFRGENSTVIDPEERLKSEKETALELIEAALSKRSAQIGDPQLKRSLELCAHLCGFHYREEKPLWWRYFNLISPELDLEDYLNEPGSIGGLRKLSERTDSKGAIFVTYGFDPLQPFKVTEQDKLLDPYFEYENRLSGGSQTSVGTLNHLDVAKGTIEIKRLKRYPSERDPQHLISWNRISALPVEKAIRRFAHQMVLVDSLDESFDCGVQLIAGKPPRFHRNGVQYQGLESFSASLDRDEVLEPLDLASTAAAALDNSYLVIQGPPGAGKTYLSARVIVSLVAMGKKVFVSANSHAAIDNVLSAIAAVQRDSEVIYKAGGEKGTIDRVKYVASNTIGDLLRCPGGLVVGGTAWAGSQEGIAKGFDYGFVDEAGQYSLANAIALSTNCKNLVLIGDPQQLPQPVIGSHPHGADASVLHHIVGDRDVVDSDHGIFLPLTYRMHPRITGVVSAVSYENKLFPAGHLSQMSIVDPSPFPECGLVFIPVQHKGNVYRSLEEVKVAKKTVEILLTRSWVDQDGLTQIITPDQIMVVSPYNAQVNALTVVLEGLASVGTVDRFQGKEAAVVIVSLAASDGESSGRGVEFLFSTNRLNVAISRAKVLSIILGSPSLLETKPKSLDQLALLGAMAKIIKNSVLVNPGELD